MVSCSCPKHVPHIYIIFFTSLLLFDSRSEDRGDGEPGACAMGDTVDERSLKDGYAAEAIVAGEACGKKYMVTVSILLKMKMRSYTGICITLMCDIL